MTRRYTPKMLTKYLIKEFTFSLFIFFLIFSSLIIFSSFIEEIIFFKNKDITNNFFLKIMTLTLIKSPTLILNFSPFIFLFSGIFFYVKFIRNNEISSMSISGFSNAFITLIPALYSFFIGIFIIIVLSPLTSELSKHYELEKNKYSNNDNLIIMSDTGIWIKEKKNQNTYIIRADRIKKGDFSVLNNLSIFIFDNQNFSGRIDGKNAKITKNTWIIQKAKFLFNDKFEEIESYKFESQIDLIKLKNFFDNADIFSIWNIFSKLKEIRERGYYGQEIIIKLNRYLSLPFLLFSMIVLSTVFTINTEQRSNNFMYAFYGVLSGIVIYFLGDLSIAIGKSGKIPLILSVWVPIIMIMIFSTYSLLRSNE